MRRFVPVAAYPVLAIVHRAARKRAIRRLAREDRDYIAETGITDVPDAALRVRAVGECTMARFIETGKESRAGEFTSEVQQVVQRKGHRQGAPLD